MPYAIFEDGSHQFRVREGDTITVDRRDGEPGSELVFDKVFLIAGDGAPTIGAPLLAGARVIAKIVREFRDKKIVIQKFRRRKNMRRRNGHRQYYTSVQITSIVGPPDRPRSLLDPPRSKTPIPLRPGRDDRFSGPSPFASDEPPLQSPTSTRSHTIDTRPCQSARFAPLQIRAGKLTLGCNREGRSTIVHATPRSEGVRTAPGRRRGEDVFLPVAIQGLT